MKKNSAITKARQRQFVLQYVQLGLDGLMDGSVSSLAPLFAAAYATHNAHTAFIVGLAKAVGAGISMAFAEALSDDGKVSGRGKPWIRKLVCGGMTLIGGIGHTLPFLLKNFWVAVWIAFGVVAIELLAIACLLLRAATRCTICLPAMRFASGVC